MPSFTNIQIEFEAYCERCGEGICNNIDTRTSKNRGTPQITVIPCESCIAEVDAEAYQRGYERAREEFQE